LLSPITFKADLDSLFETNHCVPERPIDLEKEIGRRLIVIERRYLLPSSP
jgi:hypothetical protein